MSGVLCPELYVSISKSINETVTWNCIFMIPVMLVIKSLVLVSLCIWNQHAISGAITSVSAMILFVSVDTDLPRSMELRVVYRIVVWLKNERWWLVPSVSLFFCLFLRCHFQVQITRGI